MALQSNGNVLTWGEAVNCQLGRGSRTNSSREPGIVMRNAKQIAAANDHTLVLTDDGKVYGWGMNAEGALGVGNTYDQCEGPVLIESLANLSIVRIATGRGFSVAVAANGDLYCSGANDMGQCPGDRSKATVFTKVAVPEAPDPSSDSTTGGQLDDPQVSSTSVPSSTQPAEGAYSVGEPGTPANATSPSRSTSSVTSP